MDNMASSLGVLCDRLESGSGTTAIECCVNENNLKLVCGAVSMIDLFQFHIEHNQNGGSVGVCDRRAMNTPPVANACY